MAFGKASRNSRGIRDRWRTDCFSCGIISPGWRVVWGTTAGQRSINTETQRGNYDVNILIYVTTDWIEGRKI